MPVRERCSPVRTLNRSQIRDRAGSRRPARTPRPPSPRHLAALGHQYVEVIRPGGLPLEQLCVPRVELGEELVSPVRYRGCEVGPVPPSPFTSVGTQPPDHGLLRWLDRKSTRLNSSHLGSSYAVFC